MLKNIFYQKEKGIYFSQGLNEELFRLSIKKNQIIVDVVAEVEELYFLGEEKRKIGKIVYLQLKGGTLRLERINGVWKRFSTFRFILETSLKIPAEHTQREKIVFEELLLAEFRPDLEQEENFYEKREIATGGGGVLQDGTPCLLTELKKLLPEPLLQFIVLEERAESAHPVLLDEITKAKLMGWKVFICTAFPSSGGKGGLRSRNGDKIEEEGNFYLDWTNPQVWAVLQERLRFYLDQRIDGIFYFSTKKQFQDAVFWTEKGAVSYEKLKRVFPSAWERVESFLEKRIILGDDFGGASSVFWLKIQGSKFYYNWKQLVAARLEYPQALCLFFDSPLWKDPDNLFLIFLVDCYFFRKADLYHAMLSVQRDRIRSVLEMRECFAPYLSYLTEERKWFYKKNTEDKRGNKCFLGNNLCLIWGKTMVRLGTGKWFSYNSKKVFNSDGYSLKGKRSFCVAVKEGAIVSFCDIKEKQRRTCWIIFPFSSGEESVFSYHNIMIKVIKTSETVRIWYQGVSESTKFVIVTEKARLYKVNQNGNFISMAEKKYFDVVEVCTMTREGNFEIVPIEY